MDPVIITSEGENPKSHIVAIRGASPNCYRLRLYNGLGFCKRKREKEKKKERCRHTDTEERNCPPHPHPTTPPSIS